MSIYATLWTLKFPKDGDDFAGCDWIEVIAQGVPPHIGSPSPAAHLPLLTAFSRQPAGFLCKQVVPGQHRQEAPFVGPAPAAPVAQLSERSPPKAEVAGEIPAGRTSFFWASG
jgi:hypothetical protein